MSKINKIKLSGTSYDIEDSAAQSSLSGKQDTLVSGTNIKTINNESILGSGNITIQGGGSGATVIEVTQAQYDALVSAGTLDLTALYIITDATPIDISNYWTSAQTESAISAATSGKADTSAVTESINAATSGKADSTAVTAEINAATSGLQETLVSGTNIKTINNESILGSGNITIQGGGITSGEVQSMIDESISGKVDASAVTSSVTSASTDSQIPTAKAVFDAIPQGGGGTTYSAGRGIDIDSGNTISVSLPISAGTGNNSLILGYFNSGDTSWNSIASNDGAVACGVKCTASGKYTMAVGYNNTASGGINAGNFAQGYRTTASGNRCHSEGLGTSSTADASHSEGHNTVASGNYSHSEGDEVKATNQCEHSQGRYNVSNKANTTWGDSGNTLFSVGNGTADNARHNAFEIRQNGDIYCNNGTSDVKLQDYIQYKIVQITQAAYDALISGGTVDSSTVYIIVN